MSWKIKEIQVSLSFQKNNTPTYESLNKKTASLCCTQGQLKQAKHTDGPFYIRW